MMKNKLNNETSLTLIEMVMAVVLLGFVLLAVTGIDISARKILGNVDKETVTLMDATAAMEHMVKWISLAIGDAGAMGNRGVTGGGNNVQIRLDYNASDVCLNTPDNLADDVWRRYEFNFGTRELYYWPNIAGPSQVLSARIANLDIHKNVDSAELYVWITIVARYDPFTGEGPDNPEIRLDAIVAPRSHSSEPI